jgi:hypothetical protein
LTSAEAILPKVMGSICCSWLVENCHHSDGGEYGNDKGHPYFLKSGQALSARVRAFDFVGQFEHGFLSKRCGGKFVALLTLVLAFFSGRQGDWLAWRREGPGGGEG